MRILEIFSNYAINGAAMHALQLSRELAKLGHEVTFLTQQESWASKQTLPPEVKRVEGKLNLFSPSELIRLSRWVKRENFEVVHSHNTRASNFGMIFRQFTQAKSVATAHHQNWQFHWRMHDHVIAVTEMGRQAHVQRSGVKLHNSSVVHCFVDSERFATGHTHLALPFRAKQQIPADAFVIGIVGNVETRKGHLFLVQAIPQLVKLYPQVKIAIIGDDSRPYVKQVQAMAQSLGVSDSLIWVGIQKEMLPVYAMLDALVIPSLDEQLPLVMLEAMACNLPIVATRVGGIPEVIVDGESGLLAQPADVASLQRALLKLVSDAGLRKSLALEAAKKVRTQFSPTIQAQRVVDVFEKVLDRPTNADGLGTLKKRLAA